MTTNRRIKIQVYTLGAIVLAGSLTLAAFASPADRRQVLNCIIHRMRRGCQ